LNGEKERELRECAKDRKVLETTQEGMTLGGALWWRVCIMIQGTAERGTIPVLKPDKRG